MLQKAKIWAGACILATLFLGMEAVDLLAQAQTFEMRYRSRVIPEGTFSVDQTSDEGTVMTAINVVNRPLIEKVDVNGNLVWQRRITGGQAWHGDMSIKEADNTDIVWTTGMSTTSTLRFNAHVSRRNSGGALLWSQSYLPIVAGVTWASVSASIIELKAAANAGELVTVGAADNGGLRHMHAFKTNSAGSIIWSRIFQIGNGGDIAWCVREAIDGHVVIAGDMYNHNNVAVLKLNVNTGLPIWAKVFTPNGGAPLTARSLTVDATTGTITVVGHSKATGNDDIVVFALDNAGVSLWQSRYDLLNGPGVHHNYAYSVANGYAPTASGGVMIGGRTRTTTSQAHTLLLDNAGNAIGANFYNATTNIRSIVQSKSTVATIRDGYVAGGGQLRNIGTQAFQYLWRVNTLGHNGCYNAVQVARNNLNGDWGDFNVTEYAHTLYATPILTQQNFGLTSVLRCNYAFLKQHNPSYQDEAVYVQVSELQVAPNPVAQGQALNVVCPGEKGTQATLKVVNILGQPVFEKTWKLHSDQDVLRLETNSWQNGYYILNLSIDGGSSSTQRVVVYK